jgi:hypothetical protein
MQTDFPILGARLQWVVPMGIRKLKPRYTVDEYLKIDRASQERYTFFEGEIYDMAMRIEIGGRV